MLLGASPQAQKLCRELISEVMPKSEPYSTTVLIRGL